MIDLYTVPLGATARDFFSAEAENKYSYDEALLVLPSRLLVNHARRSGRAQAVNFEYLPNRKQAAAGFASGSEIRNDFPEDTGTACG